jgi:hypothetical protein
LKVENRGVELLIARMKAHPEEFSIYNNKHQDDASRRWSWIINEVLQNNPQTGSLRFLSKDDHLALKNSLLKAQGESFTRYIMSQLLCDNEKDSRQ